MIKKTFTFLSTIACMWLCSIDAFAEDLTLENNAFTGVLTQGTNYTIQGTVTTSDWYIDPDFFTANADGSLTFKAISGTYTIVANNTLRYYQVYAGTQQTPATLNTTTGAGALWIIGSPGIGKPSFASNGANWNTGIAHDFCMAELQPGIHQITLEVGRQLNANDVNFKFFGQPAWGTEFVGKGGTCVVTTASDVFGIGQGDDNHDNGNIYLRSDVTLSIGDVCTFTVDITKGVANAVMTVDVKRSGVDLHPCFNGEEMTAIGADFIWRGELQQGECYTVSGEDAMNAADWYVNSDFFERQSDGKLMFLPLSGRYAVRADFQKRWFNVYPIDENDAPLTMNPDGSGAVYAIGVCGKPFHHYNDGESWKGDVQHAMAMAPVADKVYRLTLTVGREIPVANPEMKFYCQPGWGSEFNPGNKSQYDIYTDLNYQFVVGESDGNINADPEAIWEDGDVYVFTLDCTDITRAHLTVTGGKAIDTAISNVIYSTDIRWFNIGGLQVSNPDKGIYIRNGKKVLVNR